jgi:hypothetical protein
MVARGSVLIFFRLRLGPFEGPANVKPPALPEVSDFENEARVGTETALRALCQHAGIPQENYLL